MSDKAACAWRAELLRLFDPVLHGPEIQDEQRRTKNRTAEARRRASTAKCRSFLELVKGITGSISSQRMEELKNIFIEAGEIAYRFGTQKSWVHCCRLKDMTEPYRFRASDKSVELHRLDLPAYEEDPSSFEGRKICLVTNPAVLAFGTDDFTDYSRCRIWQPAVVCVV